MNNFYKFPSLGIEFDALKIPFFIGDYGVTWRLIFLLLGVAAGVSVFALIAGRHKLEREAFGIGALSLLIGVVGARVVGVLIGNSESMYYAGTLRYDSFLSILDLGDDKLPLYGGLLFGLAGAALLCRKRGVRVSDLCDTGAFAATAGIFVARIGDLFMQTYFGDPTTGLFGFQGNWIDEKMQVIRDAALSGGGNPFELKYIVGMPVHPVFLYEMAACAAIFALLFAVRKRRIFRGEVLIAFLALYGGARAIFEGMRLDTQPFGLLRPYQLIGAFCFVIGLIAWIVLRWQSREGNLGGLSLYREKVSDDGFGNQKTVKRQATVYTASDDQEEQQGGEDS